ncbi:MAG: SWIM zinc finger family protein [Halothece sp. Uz-M2-17]|nr:SWIM zinc finger family protein [Halothece sp. Uz-M2-17]
MRNGVAVVVWTERQGDVIRVISATPERFIQTKLQGGKYDSAEEVLEVALRLLDEYDRAESDWVEGVRVRIDAAIEASNHTAPIDGETFVNGIISRLLLKEIPDNIEETFAQLGLNFLPSTHKDFHATCSCPDWGDPCKHIAGVYYLLAAELDQDPFLLFELRGLPRDDLLKELAKSPLGEVLSAELQLEARSPEAIESYYPPLHTVKTETCQTLREFWHGSKRLPQTIDPPPQVPISGIPIKKQGDFPPFWQRDNSFLEAMETLYQQVKTKGQL